jgi:CBS domain-containing protein
MNAPYSAIAEQLARHAPFDQMKPEDLAWMVDRLSLNYHAKGAVILSPDQGEARTFSIIKQGVVQGEQEVAQSQDEDAAWLELHEGECFPLGALLSMRPVSSLYRARSDVFCYELSSADFHGLMRQSAAFHDFCTRRIANLLEQSKHIIQAQYAQTSSAQQSMNSPLGAILRREPVTCAPDAPIRAVLQTLHDHGIGAMIAVDAGIPVGIFTLHDVLNRVALPGINLDLPIMGIMSTQLTTLPPQALAYEAALAMAKHGIRHVLVTEQHQLIGIISEKDLFSLQRVGLRQISSAIRNSQSLAQLKQCALDIRQLAHNMLAQGVAAEQLTQFISTLNDLLTQRLIELECQEQGLANKLAKRDCNSLSPWERARREGDGHGAGILHDSGQQISMPVSHSELCELGVCWLALGSEGRYEQTLNTDQDNGIIFSVPEGKTADEIRATLLPLAGRINAALDVCGFPLCKGEIMASNPKWCLSLDEWKGQFSEWVQRGDAPVLLNATIFFDFRPLWGRHELARELREWLNTRIKDNRLFLKHMVQNALGNRPPLGMVRDFVVNGGTLDLKINGISPFVDAARILSLAAGSEDTSTIHRLRSACEAWEMNKGDVEGWIDAFLYLQLLRLRLQHEQCEAGAELSNRVNPDNLNSLDRRILKEAFRQARKLQAVMEKYFAF